MACPEELISCALIIISYTRHRIFAGLGRLLGERSKYVDIPVAFQAATLLAAFTYSDLENRFVDVAGTDVFFEDATGMELYASYQLNETIKVEGGYIQLDGEGSAEAEAAEIKAMPIGIVYNQGPVQLSATYEYQKSKQMDLKVDDTIIVQARYYF